MGGEMWKNNDDINVNYTAIITDSTSTPSGSYSQLNPSSVRSYGQLNPGLPLQGNQGHAMPMVTSYGLVEPSPSALMQVDSGYNNQTVQYGSTDPQGLTSMPGMNNQEFEQFQGSSNMGTTGYGFVSGYQSAAQMHTSVNPIRPDNRYIDEHLGQISNVGLECRYGNTSQNNLQFASNFDTSYDTRSTREDSALNSSQFMNLNLSDIDSNYMAQNTFSEPSTTHMGQNIRDNLGQSNTNQSPMQPKTEPISIDTTLQQQTSHSAWNSPGNFGTPQHGSWDQSHEQLHSGSSYDSIISIPSQANQVKTEDLSSDSFMFPLMTEEQDDGSKVHRRRERNRIAAQKCRQKKRDAAKGLVVQYQELESSNTNLRYEIRQFEKQKKDLERVLTDHLPHCKNQNQLCKGGKSCSSHHHDTKNPLADKPTTIDINQLSNSTLERLQCQSTNENLFSGDSSSLSQGQRTIPTTATRLSGGTATVSSPRFNNAAMTTSQHTSTPFASNISRAVNISSTSSTIPHFPSPVVPSDSSGQMQTGRLFDTSQPSYPRQNVSGGAMSSNQYQSYTSHLQRDSSSDSDFSSSSAYSKDPT